MTHMQSRNLEAMPVDQQSMQHCRYAGTRRSSRGALDNGRGDSCSGRDHQVDALERALAVLDGARTQRVGLHATNPRIEGKRVKEQDDRVDALASALAGLDEGLRIGLRTPGKQINS